MTDLAENAALASIFALNVLAAAFLVSRLRRPTRLTALPILAGAVGPLLAAVAILLVTRPGFNSATAIAACAVGAVVGAMTTLRPQTWPTPSGPMVRRPVLPLLLAAVSYLAGGAMPLVITSPEQQALGALLLIGSGGIATGSALALLPRALSTSGTGRRAAID